MPRWPDEPDEPRHDNGPNESTATPDDGKYPTLVKADREYIVKWVSVTKSIYI